MVDSWESAWAMAVLRCDSVGTGEQREVDDQPWGGGVTPRLLGGLM